jgi:hypothetical protein
VAPLAHFKASVQQAALHYDPFVCEVNGTPDA